MIAAGFLAPAAGLCPVVECVLLTVGRLQARVDERESVLAFRRMMHS